MPKPQKNHFVMIDNCTNLNRGCEGILLGSMKALDTVFGRSTYSNYYNFLKSGPDDQRKRQSEFLLNHPLYNYPRYTFPWFLKHLLLKVKPEAYWENRFKPLDRELEGCKALLAIGGDNYSVDYGYPYYHLEANRFFHGKGCPPVLWGVSVGPFDKHPREGEILENLSRYTRAIFVREKLSYDYLRKKKCKVPVHLMGDPAFLMDMEPCGPERLGFRIPKNAIGVNLSPMLLRYLPDMNIRSWRESCADLIERIQAHFGLPVVLIPHATPPWDDDDQVLRPVHQILRKRSIQVHILPRGLTGPQTKWVISKMSCLVAARTHATIAGFSNCVPTVSVAYSVKAWGINQMVFGHQRYVIDCRQLTASKVITVMEGLLKRRREIRAAMAVKVPRIKKSVYEAAHHLKSILSKSS